MIAEQLLNFRHTEPFKPFVINMADGKSYVVDHPEVLGYVPGARVAAVWSRKGNAWSQLDVSLMTSLDPYIRGRAGPRRRSR